MLVSLLFSLVVGVPRFHFFKPDIVVNPPSTPSIKLNDYKVGKYVDSSKTYFVIGKCYVISASSIACPDPLDSQAIDYFDNKYPYRMIWYIIHSNVYITSDHWQV